VASSKEVQVSRKPKQVERQRKVETVSKPETSKSAGSALAATNRWANGVVEGSPSQPKTEPSRKSAIIRVSLSVSKPKVPCRPQSFRTLASSKEVPVSRIPKDVESQPEVRSVRQPETTQSAGSALATTIRWASGVVEKSRSQPKTDGCPKSARSRVSLSAGNQPVSRVFVGHN